MSSVPDEDLSDALLPPKRLTVTRERVLSLWTLLCERNDAAAFAGTLYERDRTAHGSVLGSAVALRLFRFLVPATVAIVSLADTLPVRAALEEHLAANAATGEAASAIAEVDGWRIVSLFLTGIALTLMAGYSFTKVLVTSAATSWRMDLRQVRVRVMTVLSSAGSSSRGSRSPRSSRCCANTRASSAHRPCGSPSRRTPALPGSV